jgi:hypothetical protein
VDLGAVNWTAFGAISSCAISGFALVVAFLSYRNNAQIRRRTDWQIFIQESAYASDRLGQHLRGAVGEPAAALAAVDDDFLNRLLLLDSRAATWPDEPLPRSFKELVAAVEKLRPAAKSYVAGQEQFTRRTSAGEGIDGDFEARLDDELAAWADTTHIALRLATAYSVAARAKLAAN